MEPSSTQSPPAAAARRFLVVFNARNQLWVEGEGSARAPLRPFEVPPEIADEDVPDYARLRLPAAGAARAVEAPGLAADDLALWWARWNHPLEETPTPPESPPGRWISLQALRASLDTGDPVPDPVWATLLPVMRAHAIDIPYLNFGQNEFIYRFRTDRQRNRAVYQSDETSRGLYQSRLCAAVKSARRLRENRSGACARIDFGAVEYVLPSHFGFCLGVQNAIERAYEVLAENPGQRVFMLSELIHNPFVNNDLQRRGLRYLQSDKGVPRENPETGAPYWEELSEDDIVVIPAFGATNEDKVRLIERGLPLNEFDATCMLVEKVWKAGRRFAREGYTVVIHGKAEHEETKATFSNVAHLGPAVVVRDGREAERLGRIIRTSDPTTRRELFNVQFAGRATPGFDPVQDLTRLAVVNQTTLLRNETLRIIAQLETDLRAVYGEDLAHHFHPQSRGDTLCYATQVNQDALQQALREPLDLALVAGGKNSSNTFQLYRVCADALGERAHYIQSEDNLLPGPAVRHYHFAQHLDDAKSGTFSERPIEIPTDRPMRILVTGGASCPDGIIQQIITRFNRFFSAERLRPIEEVVEELETLVSR